MGVREGGRRGDEPKDFQDAWETFYDAKEKPLGRCFFC
jgi:hypothetical protein